MASPSKLRSKEDQENFDSLLNSLSKTNTTAHSTEVRTQGIKSRHAKRSKGRR